MTKAQYNYLTDKDKLNVAWHLWNTYIDLDSPIYDEELHFLLYGSRRLMVNSKSVIARGSDIFNNEIIRRLDLRKIPPTDMVWFPIEYLSNKFNHIKTVMVTRSIPKARFHWIEFDTKQGDVFVNTNDSGHGTKSVWGLGCKNMYFDGICEIPMQYLEPTNLKLK